MEILSDTKTVCLELKNNVFVHCPVLQYIHVLIASKALDLNRIIFIEASILAQEANSIESCFAYMEVHVVSENIYFIEFFTTLKEFLAENYADPISV